MFNERLQIAGEWKVIEKDLDGNIIQESPGHNLITNTGKQMLLTLLFCMNGSGVSSAIVACAGACSTVATLADTTLNYELIANGNRIPITNLAGAALSTADIQSGSFVVNTVTYTRKVTCQAIWGSSDLNLNQPFREYAIATALACPTTPTGTSGVIFNHYIDTQNIVKTGSNSITIQFSVYF